MPKPEEEILKAGAKLIHKFMHHNKTPSIKRLITRTKRTTSNFYHIMPKKKSFRTPLEVLLQLYNRIPADYKSLTPHTFKKKLKKHDIDFVPAP